MNQYYEPREIWIVDFDNQALTHKKTSLPKNISAEDLRTRYCSWGSTYFTQEEAEKAIRDWRDEKKNQKQEAILAKKRFKDALKK